MQKLLLIPIVWATLCVAVAQAEIPTFAKIVERSETRVVKIYGAGGIRGLEAYQSGFIFSAEGHILTVWSYVLDSDFIAVVLDDGRRLEAKLVGHDPRLEIAVLKVDATALPFFNLDAATPLKSGARVLAFSNLYGVATGDEPASVLHGQVSVKTKLSARRGAFKTPYDGDVYILDAMTNNPGSAGGALTDRQGRLAAIIGKELRSAENNIWLNYAIPIDALTGSVGDILSGVVTPLQEKENAKPAAAPISLAQIGVVLVPDVLAKTPPFIDRIDRDSPAAKAGLRVDDLILFVNRRIISSCDELRRELSFIDRDEKIRLTVQRGQELIEIAINE
ncbi:MAG: S1C family serine protease [bacterium]|nr:S1C family serine protease [bacterium]